MTVKPASVPGSLFRHFNVYDGPVRIAIIREDWPGRYTLVKGQCDMAEADRLIVKLNYSPTKRGGL